MFDYKTLNEGLKACSKLTNKGVTFISGNTEQTFLSYNKLYTNALKLLAVIRAKGVRAGEEIIFQVKDEAFFLTLFWACLLGKIIPVPLSVGARDEHRLKVINVWKTLNSPHIVISASHTLKIETIIDGDSRANQERIHFIEDLQSALKKITVANIPVNDNATLDDIAFIQFSSGSTGHPKGVTLTHKNLLTNIHAIIKMGGIHHDDSALSWLPLTHDMGMIGFHLVPLITGISQYLMSPISFIRNPAFWLESVNKHKATLLGAPNFGFKHYLTFFDKNNANGLNLSQVRLIFNGAEPISESICHEFIKTLQPFGLKKNVILPVYGLAEACLVVTSSDPNDEISSAVVDRRHLTIGERVSFLDQNETNAFRLVGVGEPVDRVDIRIVDENGSELGESSMGNIQIRGDSVTSLYYNNPIATAQAIRPDGWLNTGDIGFVKDRQLFVAGRAKDLIFNCGKNFYAHDLERIAEELPGIGLGEIVATGLWGNGQDEDEILLFLLFHGSNTDDFVELGNTIKHHVSKKSGLKINHVIPIKSIPRTTSGKVQRFKLAEAYRCGQFNQKTHLFCLGIDSIMLTQLICRIQEQYGVTIPLKTLYAELTTLEKIVEFICKNKQSHRAETSALPVSLADSMSESVSISDSKITNLMSSAQKRMFALSRTEMGEITYHINCVYKIEGRLDRKKLDYCCQELVKRHESLRTGFMIQEGRFLQQCRLKADFRLGYRRISENDVEGRIQTFFCKRFDLSTPPLIEGEILELSAESFLFLIKFHHIIADGYSATILMQELVQLYKNIPLPLVKKQYSHYTDWEKSYYNSSEFKTDETFWMEKFERSLPVLELPTDFVRPPVHTFEGRSLSFTIEAVLTRKLRLLAKASGCTLYMVLLAAFHTLLYKLTGQTEIIVGTPVAVRHSGFDFTVGMFTNTLALKNTISAEKKFSSFLDDIKYNCLDYYAHQSYPFEMLVNALNIKSVPNRNPLFDVMFAYEDARGRVVSMDNLTFSRVEFDMPSAMFDLDLDIIEEENSLSAKFHYDSKLFRYQTIEKWKDFFERILTLIVQNPHIIPDEMDILSNAEKNLILNAFNRTFADYPQDRTIHQLFEEQVAEFPDKIAVVYDERTLTYKELNEKANQLARRLRENGVTKNCIVGIMLEKSIEMIVGILAVLKAGGAYCPISPAYPESRILYMLDNSNTSLLLTSLNLKVPSHFKGSIIDIADPVFYTGQTANLRNVNTPDDLVYLIYTSGSTGRPKGVMVSHTNFVNTALGWRDHYHLTSIDVNLLQMADFSFDVFSGDLARTLLNAGKLVLFPEEMRLNIPALYDLIQKHEVTLFEGTPSLVLPLMNYVHRHQLPLHRLQLLILGSDVCNYRDFNLLVERFGKSMRIINSYGTTEATIDSSYFEEKAEDCLSSQECVPIGKPLPNVTFYILNKRQQIQPIGVVGELYIGGRSVSKGYFNRPDLTTKKFLPDPYSSSKDAVMYKTGDLGRWLPDGNVEFLGRCDNQVKIRGYRVHLGEVAGVFKEHEKIHDVVIAAKETTSNEKKLVAYIVSPFLMGSEKRESRGKCISLKSLKKFAEKRLPGYMIPSFFVKIDRIPLTLNGKVDIKALPDPLESCCANRNLHGPKNSKEIEIIRVWQDVLGREKIGVDDDFFELGGSSIEIIASLEKLQQVFNVNLNDLFEHSRVSDLANILTYKKTDIKKKHAQIQAVLISREHRLDVIKNNREFHKAYEHYKHKCYGNGKIAPYARKAYNHILLTGSTGYVGAHLLHDLLLKTESRITLIVRGEQFS